MPDEVRDSIWYNTVAQKHIEEHVRRTLFLMNTEKGIPEEYVDTRFCPRGLEGRTRKAMKRRTIDRYAVRDAVFVMQQQQQALLEEPQKRKQQQQQQDENNPPLPTTTDRIVLAAKVLHDATISAQEEARRLAEWDEREAKEYLKDVVFDELGSP